MARASLSSLGGAGLDLLQADRAHIWINPDTHPEVDLEVQEEKLRSALKGEPGMERDNQLVLALADAGALLEDEPFAEWALGPRERFEWVRQEGRLALARDRTRGKGRSQPEGVIEAWEDCLSHDPTSEEAASALMRVYAAQGRQQLVSSTYERCRAALEDLGLRISPALEEVRWPTTTAAGLSRGTETPPHPAPVRYMEERRLVSVLFTELAGPTGTGQRLGPEDLRELVGGALAEVIAQVEALAGTVTSVSGAGLVALFGAPVSHQDDPERAVLAAFRAVSGAGDRAEGLSVRAGIETGQAVVGPIGRGWTAHYGAVGEVVGVAAALQSVARPASVLVGPATRAATEGLFEWGPTEEVVTSRGAKPIVASYLERPKARPSGQAGRHRLTRSAPLMGRQAELSVFLEALREATSGRGGVVTVVGDPGLGKTRLVYECRKLFLAWVGAVSGRLPLWLEGRAASYASSTPYGLYQQLFARWVGVTVEEGDKLSRPALEMAMKAVFGGEASEEQVGLLAQMMGLRPGKAGPGFAQLSPEQLQRATFETLRALVSKLVAHGPTVLVLEDLHWADPTSLHLTEELSSLAKEGPLLLVLTRRPEPDPGVSALEGALELDPDLKLCRLELSPLAQDAERDLVRALIGGEVPEEVVNVVSQSAGGNPFFLEERLSSLMETGALIKDETGWRLELGPSAELPDAIERLVRSRVDRLDPDSHDVIVAASVLGAEFGLRALGTVTDLDGGLVDAVSRLCSAGLLVELRKLPEPAYRFRHALVQEAAYKGLLRDQRRRLHARAAWGLEELASGNLEEVAAVLGHHYAMAGETRRAASYLELAGDHAASAFANDEAIASYRYGLDVLGQDGVSPDHPGGDANAKAAVGLRAKLGEVLLRTGRHGEAREALQGAWPLVSAQDRSRAARLQALLGRVEIADHRYDAAMAAFDAADELIGEHPEDQDQATTDLWLEVQLDGRTYLHYWRNEPDKAAAVLAAARPVVEARGTPARRQTFHMNFALQQSREKRYRIDEEILTNMRAAVAAAQEGGHEYGIAFTLFGLGFCLLWYGDLVEALERLEASLAVAERIGDVVLRARCLCYLNVTALRRNDLEAVRSLAPEAIAAGEAAAYTEYVAAGKATQAWVAWRDERFEDVVTLANEALELWATTVVSYSWYWLCLWPLIAVRLASGQLAEAVEAGRQLLVTPQQRLPDELESMVQAAIAAWGSGEPQLARGTLGEAVELARRLRYA